MKFNYVFILCVSLLVTGCYTEKHVVDPTSKFDNFKIPVGSSAYVGKNEDGQYENIVYSQSATMTSLAIKNALSRHIRDILQGKDTESFDQALTNTKANNKDYLFYPTILGWEDRATEWSGIADKINILIVVVDAKTGTEMSSVEIKSNSSYYTLGGDKPQDLLEKPISEYVDSLF